MSLMPTRTCLPPVNTKSAARVWNVNVSSCAARAVLFTTLRNGSLGNTPVSFVTTMSEESDNDPHAVIICCSVSTTHCALQEGVTVKTAIMMLRRLRKKANVGC